MLSIKFETSERSASSNWVINQILASNLKLLAFEGYTVKNNLVSAVLDRGLFDVDCHSIDANELYTLLKQNSAFHYLSKVKFAERLNCPFLFFCYTYNNENCVVYQLLENNVQLVESFSTWKEFAEWLQSYRDLIMSSAYQESGLPRIDIQLRILRMPWPGNLDYALLKNNDITALIEFQNTTKFSVANHCNNTWFLPSASGRKGDEQRWKVIDIIRLQSGLPLFIIVWSKDELVVKLKLVEKIVYSNDSEPEKGLKYRNKQIMPADMMINVLNKF